MNIRLYIICIGLLFIAACEADQLAGESGAGSIAGSYARMLTIGQHLYVLDDSRLSTFNLSDPLTPSLVERIDVGENLETIFFNGDFIFVGSNEGMYIYSIQSNGVPQLESLTPYEEWTEVLPCDPIVADDRFAYVTLSTSGFVDDGECARFEQINELRIFDIEDETKPVQIALLDMEEPKGLAVDGNLLFVCEKNNGIKVMDISNKAEPEVIVHQAGFEAIDCIAYNGLLMVVNSTSVIQFEYGEDQFDQISVIEF